MTGRDHAEALDAADPLAAFRDRFVVADDVVYLDGNSLGRLPHATFARLVTLLAEEWGRGLVGSWEEWIDLPLRVGDLLSEAVLGARPGEVVVADSTTVNLYKLAAAALDARPDRSVVVTDADNFPTDRYVLDGLARARGLSFRTFEADPVAGPDEKSVARALGVGDDVALLCLSHVAYRSGALADMAALNRVAHDAGALVLWDLSHSVGAVPVELEAARADLAVGCTYKYLNAGPGAPAFAYVRSALQPHLRQPIWGWFAQEDQFAMGEGYRPVAGVGQQLAGSPNVLGLASVEVGVQILAEAGIERLRQKSVGLTELAVELHDAWLAPLGTWLGTPRDPTRRGAHVAVRHPDAYRVCRALIEKAHVVPDYRPPDSVRLGFPPIYTRYVDVWEGMRSLREVLTSRAYLDVDPTPRRVT